MSPQTLSVQRSSDVTNETVNPGPRVYTAAEASVLLRCKASWLEDQARRRRIPFSMIGGSYRFSDQHVAEIIAIYEQRPEDAAPPKAVRRRTGADDQPAGPVSLQARRPRRKQATITGPSTAARVIGTGSG